MRLPSNAETDNKKTSQASNMDDLCHIKHVSMSSGTYGNSVENYTNVTGVACGIQFTNTNIRQGGGQVLLVDYDVLLRLPLGTNIFITDEFTLVEKGDTQISGSFKPNGLPTVNSSVQHLQLRRVST